MPVPAAAGGDQHRLAGQQAVYWGRVGGTSGTGILGSVDVGGGRCRRHADGGVDEVGDEAS